MRHIDHIVASTSAAQRLAALEKTVARLGRDFGSWQTPWGEINRFQRLTGDIREAYDDARPSLPVGGTGTMVIPAPSDVDELMRRVPKGCVTTINQLRAALARRAGVGAYWEAAK